MKTEYEMESNPAVRIILCDSYNEISERAAELIRAQIILKPDCVLGLATGSSPVGMYDRLAEMNLDFSGVTTFNLDEYYPISRENDQSYYYFMQKHLYSRVNLRPENINIPSGEVDDVDAECREYEEKIQAAGGIDSSADHSEARLRSWPCYRLVARGNV